MFPVVIYGYPGDQHKTAATKWLPFGTKMILSDGREFRYGRNGAVLGVAGNLYQAATLEANHVSLDVQTAGAVGDVTQKVTLGATAAAADLYLDGFLAGEDSAGTGYQYAYQISSHRAVASAGTFTVPLNEPLKVATTTSTQFSLFKNLYDGVLIHPSPPILPVAGVLPNATTASYYCWMQTKGFASVLSEGTLVVGRNAMPSAVTNGAFGPWTAGGTDEIAVAIVHRVVGDAKYAGVILTIPGG